MVYQRCWCPFCCYCQKVSLEGKAYGLENKDNTEALNKINDFEWLREQFVASMKKELLISNDKNGFKSIHHLKVETGWGYFYRLWHSLCNSWALIVIAFKSVVHGLFHRLESRRTKGVIRMYRL